MAKKNGGAAVIEGGPTQSDAAARMAAEHKPILGVDVKGELRDVAISKIVDPQGPSDRLSRPGDVAAIEQLARSMRECGQLQPAMLEELADGRFCRVFGRRRIAAAKQLGWTTIRASVVPPLADEVRRTIVAVENVQRQDLTPAEETLAVDELMLLQGLAAARNLGKPLIPGCGALSGKVVTVEIMNDAAVDPRHQAALAHDALLDPRVRNIASELVAAMLGKPAAWVRDRLYISRLSPKSKKLVLEGKLPLAHAREISKLGDPDHRDALAEDFAAGGDQAISDTEPGKLEELQMEVRRSVFSLHVVDWRLDVPVAGRVACASCPHNSASSPGLFEVGGDVSLEMVGGRGTYGSADAGSPKVQMAGICTLPSCYQEKQRATKGAISACAKRVVDGKKTLVDAKPPTFVVPAAIEKKVRERKEMVGSRGRSIKVSQQDKPTRVEIPWEIQNKHAIAVRLWEEKLGQDIDAAFATTPEGRLLALLVINMPIWAKATSYGGEKACKSPEFTALVSKLKNPAKVDVLKLVQDIKLDKGETWLAYGHHDGGTIRTAVANVLGVKVDPKPDIKDLLPKKDQKPADTAASSKATPPGRKKAGAKPSKKKSTK